VWSAIFEIALLVLKWGFAFWTGRAQAAKSAKGRVRERQKRKLEDVEAMLRKDSGELSRSGYVDALILRQLLRERRLRLKAKPSD
jgi:DNA topoisomerase IB